MHCLDRKGMTGSQEMFIKAFMVFTCGLHTGLSANLLCAEFGVVCVSE